MKKVLHRYSVVAFALLLFSLVAKAQDTPPVEKKPYTAITGGALVEANVTGFFHSGIGGGASRMKPGLSAGGFLNFGIVRSFSVQGEMIFHYKHSNFEWDGQIGKFLYWGVEIPIYAFYHIELRKGERMSFGFGPYTEFGFGASFKHDGIKNNLFETDESSGLPVLRDSNSGFGIKASYEFPSGLQLNVAYKASITNLLDANSNTANMYPHALSVGIAYRFRK